MLYIHEHTQNKGTRCSNNFLRNITMYYVSVYHLTRQYRMCHFTKKFYGLHDQTNSVRALKDNDQSTQMVPFSTSLSETIRKPPLVKAPTALKKQKINLAKNDFQYRGWNYYTLQCRMWLWNHDIEFARWQHHAVCQLALG